MGKYEPPYTISNKMLELVSSISEKVGKISSHRELEARPHLRKNNRIRSIHSSLKIEANSLSLAEVREGHPPRRRPAEAGGGRRAAGYLGAGL